MEGLTGLLRPHGKGILERVVRAMSIRLQHLDPQFNLWHMADLINTEVDKEVEVQMHMAIDFQLLPTGGTGVVLPRVEQGRRFRHLDVVVQVQVTRRANLFLT